MGGDFQARAVDHQVKAEEGEKKGEKGAAFEFFPEEQGTEDKDQNRGQVMGKNALFDYCTFS